MDGTLSCSKSIPLQMIGTYFSTPKKRTNVRPLRAPAREVSSKIYEHIGQKGMVYTMCGMGLGI